MTPPAPDRDLAERSLRVLLERTTTSARRATGPSPEGPVEGSPGAVAAVDHPDWPEGPVLVAAGTTHRSGTAPDTPRAVTPGTLFDLASVTKVVTTLTAARLHDAGTLDLDAPTAESVPGADPRITPRHLLTHTAGLPPTLPLWRRSDRAAALAEVRRTPLLTDPGTAHAYSCIGFVLLGLQLEALTGRPLPELARELVLRPAGADGARWADRPRGTLDGEDDVAATEIGEDPPRGLVRGATHDETAWALGGVGNAGVFATAEDLLAIGRVLVGRSPGVPLAPGTRRLLGTDQLPGGVATDAPWRQGLGLRIGQDLAHRDPGARVIGHRGFTGPSVVADPETGTVAVLLANRVHPDRTWFTVEATQRRIAEIAAGISPRS